MADELQWDEETSRAYARYMEMNVPYDHRRFARRIVADWPELPQQPTIVDVAGGPGFLLFEVAPLLRAHHPKLILTDVVPLMLEIGRERAAGRGLSVETRPCPAETLDLAAASADLILCKHFLRFASDLDACLREMARVLKPGGRAYLMDFNRERPWLGSHLLTLWIKLTAPSFISAGFPATMDAGVSASTLPARLRAAGFAEADVLQSSVSYLVRAVR